MSLHRRNGQPGLSFPQLGLGIVAIAAVTIAVLINQPNGSPAADDTGGAGTTATATSAGTAGSRTAGAASGSTASPGRATAAATPPSTGRKDSASGAGPVPADTAVRPTPAPTVAMVAPRQFSLPRRHPSASPSTGLRLPPVTLPTCVLDC
ncbi:hypothetical protein [Frankia sp. AgB32]|uniref:hypothetical protein n=1 Tax=Frankia sp. AgB32 TaxID=631119 RepID=UPI00200EA46C|nr:hypothetical protein [Frankia sp. AgB32]MCK9896643.1 hypothetical protein [Frankia sp. AgB32]